MMNEWVKQKFVTKAKIIKYLRSFLDNLGFLEVRMRIALVIHAAQANELTFPSFFYF
jgi:lysyl-tRNA synthetase class II